MPTNPTSLAVTDAYRKRMVAIRHEGEGIARRVWGDVDPADVSGTFLVGPLAIAIAALQKTGVLLSSAYVKAYIRSEIGKDVLIPTPKGFAGTSWSDIALRTAFMRAVVVVQKYLAQGAPEPEAMLRGRNALLRSVGLATDSAIRDSLQQLYVKQPEVTGWIRALGGTCDKCIGKATNSTLPPGEALDIHPNCVCVSEAVVSTGIHSWDGVKWDPRSGQRPREGETAPERTEGGDFVLYHGTSENAAKAIVKEKRIRPDDLGKVGFTTTPGAAQSYSSIKGGPVLRAVVQKDELKKFIAQHEIGGSGTNQLLFRPPRKKGEPLRPTWNGIATSGSPTPYVFRDSGQELFDAMSKAEQDATFGPDTAGALREGRVALSDIATVKNGFLVRQPTVGGPERGAVAQKIFGTATDSIDLHTDAEGVFTEERYQLHQDIIDKFLAGHEPHEQKQALFTAGGPGAGKSSMLSSLSPPPDAVGINPDLVKEELPEFQEMADARDPFAAFGVHEESSMLAKEIARQAQEKNLNLIVDGVGDGVPGKFRAKMDKAVADGYQVDVAVAYLPPDIGQQRVAERAAATGRAVPPDIVQEAYRAAASRFGDYKNDSDLELRVYDTNVPKGEPAVQIANKPRGDVHLNVTDPAKLDEFQSEATLPEATTVKEYLQMVATQFPDAPSGEKLVLEDGTNFTPQELPEKYAELRGPTGNCYQNAADVAVGLGGFTTEHPELTYVEGWATPKDLSIPIHHAWLVDADGNVIDNTWPDAGTSYRGIKVPADRLRLLLIQQEYYGVLATLAKETSGTSES